MHGRTMSLSRVRFGFSTGTTQLLKTLLGQVPGVQQRLVSTRKKSTGWEVIVGGGDPYLVAYAIYDSGLNIQTLPCAAPCTEFLRVLIPATRCARSV